MALFAAPQPMAEIHFAGPVVSWINLALTVFAVALEVVAFVHCLLQRSDAFSAIGTLSKGIWLALTGGGVVLSLLLGASPIGLLGMIGLVASAVYWLDVRPAIRDVVSGGGSW